MQSSSNRDGSAKNGEYWPDGIAYLNVVAGALPCTVSVGAAGGARCSTDLKIVPGVAGMEPSIGITYEGSGYGGLGLGFSLDAGAGQVTRCRRTLGRDGEHAPIDWSLSDRICLDGQRLEAVKGAYGASGTEYRVSSPTSPNMRVVGIGASTDALSGFEAHTPDGRVTHYGVVPGVEWTQESMQWAQVDGKKIPFAWNASRVIDALTHNQMAYRYKGKGVLGDGLITPEDHRLERVLYGLNPKGGADYTRQVLFDYTPVQELLGEPKAWEPSAWLHQGAVAGQLYTRRHALRVVEMQVKVPGEPWMPVRHYRLGYEPVSVVTTDDATTPENETGTSDRVRLRALQECALGHPGTLEPMEVDTTPCFEPTRFEWSQLPEDDAGKARMLKPMPGYGWDGASFYPLPPANELDSADYPRPATQVVVDFDGDGDEDMLVMPEMMNTDVVPLLFWQYWQTDEDVHGPVSTDVPAWSAYAWTNRAGTVVPKVGAIQGWTHNGNLEPIDQIPRPPEKVQHGRRRDIKATPNAWAMNYDGTGGTDVLLGEPVQELAGAMMDDPWGVGSHTVVGRMFDETQSPTCPFKKVLHEHLLECIDGLQRSLADYTAHPGFMKGLKVLRLARSTGDTTSGGAGNAGQQVRFEQVSLNYRDGRPILWAQPLDMDGDALFEVMFCKADADYAKVSGQSLPMFYGPDPDFDPVNWVSGTLHYAMNVPGKGIDLSQGGKPVLQVTGSTTEPVPCHAKDSYLVMDLDGDGTQSLLHRRHGDVRKLQIGPGPSLPDGKVDDPYPFDPADSELDGYWPKLTKYVWAKTPLGEVFYDAYTYRVGQGVQPQSTTLPFEQFMAWQQNAGNTTRRYSTHNAVPNNADVDGGPDPIDWDGQITDWGDPNNPMVGGPSSVRKGDFNGDGLEDVAMVDMQHCYALRKSQVEGKAPLAIGETCSFRSVLEWGANLLEQSYEKLGVFVYLSRGDGTFELADGGMRLWDTDMEPWNADAEPTHQKEVLEFLYGGAELDPSFGLDAIEIDQIHRDAWVRATAATRAWRMEFGNSLVGDANGDGLADLGFIRADFEANGGWLGDSMAGTYKLTPVWHLARHGGGLSPLATPMGIDIDTLVPESALKGFPGTQRDLTGNKPTRWLHADDSAATVDPYEQQMYGMSARLLPLDVDKDGRQEFAFYDHVRGQYRLAGLPALATDDEPQPHLLTAVVDGFGARTELDYLPQWTMTTPSTPWTQQDVDLPYPFHRRPSTAAAVARLRNDTGQDDDDAPVYLTTHYLYGKSTTDVRRAIGLGIERSSSWQSVLTPSGTVNHVRLSRYDVTPSYDEAFKAYPLAGALLSEAAMSWGVSGEAVRLSHSGHRSSAHPGKIGPTWYRRIDESTSTEFEIGDDVPTSAGNTLFECLTQAYDAVTECVLGPQTSYQPLRRSTKVIGYDPDGYGLAASEIVEEAGTTSVTESVYEHHDPAQLGGIEPYVLGLPTLKSEAHEPSPNAGFTLRTVAHGYAFNGMLKSTTVEPDQPQYRSSSTFDYDGFGNVRKQTVSVAGHPDNVTTFEYSASGAYPTTITNALGHHTTTRWYEGCALPEQVTNSLGQTQVSDTDEFCRERGGQLFYGDTPLTRTTRVDYFGNGAPWMIEDDYPAELFKQSAMGAIAYVGDDGDVPKAENMRSISLSNRTGQTFLQHERAFGFDTYTQTRRDALDRVTEVSLPTKVGETPLGWTTKTYDHQGRVIGVTKPDNTQQTTTYNRHVTTVTNEIGVSGSSEVNALGQVVRVIPPADPDLPGVDLSMCYDYGAFGVLTSARPCTPTAVKGATTLNYDDYGRMTSSESAQSGIRLTRYDALGRIDETEDAIGQIVKHTYDVLGRLATRTEHFGKPEARTATWDYDEVTGVLTQTVSADGTVIEEPLLDEYNRVAGMTTTIHGRGYTQRIGYDGWGRIASQTYPTLSLLAPVKTGTQYNDLDQVSRLMHQGATLWRPVTTDVWGHLTEQRYGADAPHVLSAHASYNELTGRLEESRVDRHVVLEDQSEHDYALERFTYNWYDHGLIRMRIQHALTQQQTDQADQFFYTPREELKGWTTIGANNAVKQHHMQYDGFGNVTGSTRTGKSTYFDEKLLLIEGPLGDIGYTYTDNGQVLTRTHAGGETKLTYDGSGRVSQIESPTSPQRITYNADGDKVHTLDTLTGRETFYLGAYQEERGGELDSKGVVIGRYAFGPAHLTRTWQKDLTYTDELSYTPLADHLGSTTLVTDATGEIQERRSYDTWGNERDPADWNAFKAAPKDDVQTPVAGYTGHHERKQFGATAPGISGLIDMQTRYYDPTAMQFLQPDTIVPDIFSPLSWNLRTYVNNSPVMFSDETGMAAQFSETNQETMERKSEELGDFSDGTQPVGNGQFADGPVGMVAGAALSNLRKISNALKFAKDAAVYAEEQRVAAAPNEDCMACTKVKAPGHTASELNSIYAEWKKRSEDGNGPAAGMTGRHLGFQSFADFAMWYKFGGGKESIERMNDAVPMVGGAGATKTAKVLATANRARAVQLAAKARALRMAASAKAANTARVAAGKAVMPGAERAINLAVRDADVALGKTHRVGSTGISFEVRVDGTYAATVVVNSRNVGVVVAASEATPANFRYFLGQIQSGYYSKYSRLGVGSVTVYTTSPVHRDALTQSLHSMFRGDAGIRITSNRNGVRLEAAIPELTGRYK